MSSLLSHKSAFFFDMDGVIFDSMPCHTLAWEEVLARHGMVFHPDECYINEGRTGRDVIQMVSKRHHISLTEQQIKTIYEEKTQAFHARGGAVPMAGVDAVLQRLQQCQCQIWVVTGGGQYDLWEQLECFFPGVFSQKRIVSAHDVTHGKPHPEPYLQAWQRCGLPKEACCVVENAPLGVRAGKAADLYTIAVNTGPLPDSLLLQEGADQVVPDMSALLHLL